MVRDKHSGEKFAMKTMILDNLRDKEKRSALDEVEFLRVITGPTIIKFIESFNQNSKLYIIMELAEGGSLSDLISKHKMLGKKFTSDQILTYTAQITLSLLALHSKTILHRDVKTQNIFIKDGVLKLGDFGISKELVHELDMAQTKCGTPYFMPPEVCQNEPYDAKADVWAMGVIVYELVTLKKPFDGDNIPNLFHQIINTSIDILPEGTTADLQLVVKALLNKDKENRPTIFAVAKIPCIKAKIEEFIKDHDCGEEVVSFFDTDPIKTKPLGRPGHGDNQTGYQLEQFEDWAEIMHRELQI